MTNKIEIRSNPKLTPTLAKGKLVCLTKDLYSQSDIANNFHPAKKYFKKIVFLVLLSVDCLNVL